MLEKSYYIAKLIKNYLVYNIKHSREIKKKSDQKHALTYTVAHKIYNNFVK
jgi:hypothetical protein